MKQTRKQELKTNDLSLYLRQLSATIQKNSTYILGGVLAIVIILVIGLLMKQRQLNTEQGAWGTYYELVEKDPTTDRDALDRVKELSAAWGSDSKLGPAVLHLQALMQNKLALSLTDPKDKDRKIQYLKEEVATAQRMLERFGDRPAFAAEATMNLATAEESLAVLGAGSAEKVRGYYDKLVKTRPNAYAEIAEARLKELDTRLAPLTVVATRPAEPPASAPALNLAPLTTRPMAASAPSVMMAPPSSTPATTPAR